MPCIYNSLVNRAFNEQQIAISEYVRVSPCRLCSRIQRCARMCMKNDVIYVTARVYLHRSSRFGCRWLVTNIIETSVQTASLVKWRIVCGAARL